LLGKRHRVIKRFLADFGEIDWHQDTLEPEDGRSKLDSIGAGFAAWLSWFCQGADDLLILDV
jgi:hypothetical protein